MRSFFFFYTRITGSSITMDEARDYELSLPIGDRPTSTVDINISAQVNSPATDENRVLTFAELKELIESGNIDKIPNNKIIPETLNVRFFLELSQKYFLISIYLYRMRLQVNRWLLQKRNLGRWKQQHHHKKQVNSFFHYTHIRLL